MRRAQVAFLAAAFLTAAFGAVPARGENARTGTASAVYLRTARPASSAAMGDVTAAVDRGIWSAWGNPAGLIRLSKREIGLTRIQSFSDISINMVGYAQPVSDRNVLAVSYMGVEYGRIEGRDATGRATGDVRTGDDAGAVTWGRRWREGDIATGVTLRYVSSRLGTHRADAFTFDIGATWRTSVPGLTIGVVGQNLTGDLTFVRESSPLPRTVRIGVSQRLIHDRLLVAVDVVRGVDTDWEVGGGLELAVTRSVFLRAGGVSDRDVGDPFTVGVGFQAWRLGLDYAYLPFGALGDQHRVSMRAEF